MDGRRQSRRRNLRQQQLRPPPLRRLSALLVVKPWRPPSRKAEAAASLLVEVQRLQYQRLGGLALHRSDAAGREKGSSSRAAPPRAYLQRASTFAMRDLTMNDDVERTTSRMLSFHSAACVRAGAAADAHHLIDNMPRLLFASFCAAAVMNRRSTQDQPAEGATAASIKDFTGRTDAPSSRATTTALRGACLGWVRTSCGFEVITERTSFANLTLLARPGAAACGVAPTTRQ